MQDQLLIFLPCSSSSASHSNSLVFVWTSLFGVQQAVIIFAWYPNCPTQASKKDGRRFSGTNLVENV